MVHDLTVTAPLEQVYDLVAQQLMGMEDTNGQPVFNYVGMWTKQPDDELQPAPFPLPAALVELSSVEWDMIGEDDETAIVILTLHVLDTQQNENDFSAYRLSHAAEKEIKSIGNVSIGEPIKVSTLVDNAQAAYLRISETYNLYTVNRLSEH